MRKLYKKKQLLKLRLQTLPLGLRLITVKLRIREQIDQVSGQIKTEEGLLTAALQCLSKEINVN